MSYVIEYGSFTSIFAIPSVVVEKHLTSCNAIGLKVLLMVLHNPSMPIVAGRIAGFLGLPTSEVAQALDYWVSQGILKNKAQIELDTDVIPVQQTMDFVKESTKPNKESKPNSTKESQQQKIITISSRKNITMDEIDTLSKTDPVIREIIDNAQSMIGRTLSRTEIENLVSLYSYVGLSPEYIYLCMDYCFNTLGKRSISYLSRIINDFIADDIDTYDKAESHVEYLNKSSGYQGQIRTIFAIYDRNLTSQEKKYIDTWFSSYKYDIPLIRIAYERTIDNIGKLSFKYINSILSNWYTKGIKTTQQALQEILTHQNENSTIPTKTPTKAMSSSIDMDELQYIITYGKMPDKK